MARRLAIYGIPGFLVLIAAGYGAFWWLAADAAVAGIDRWAEERRRDGWTVRYDPPETRGFPFTLALDITGPRIEAPTGDGSIAWSGVALTARTKPWRFQTVDFTILGAHETRHVHLPTRRVTVTRGDGGGGTVRIGPDGRAQEVQLSVTSLKVDAPELEDDIKVESMVATLFPTDDGRSVRALRARAYAITLPSAVPPLLGPMVQRLEIAASLARPVPAGPVPDSLAAWRDAGGALDVERLGVRWGPLDVDVKGRVVLDRDLQPAGEFSLGAEGFRETLAALVRAGAMKSKDAATTGLVLSLFSRRGPGGRRRLTVPIAIADRKVTAGPQQIAILPRIVWK